MCALASLVTRGAPLAHPTRTPTHPLTATCAGARRGAGLRSGRSVRRPGRAHQQCACEAMRASPHSSCDSRDCTCGRASRQRSARCYRCARASRRAADGVVRLPVREARLTLSSSSLLRTWELLDLPAPSLLSPPVARSSSPTQPSPARLPRAPSPSTNPDRVPGRGYSWDSQGRWYSSPVVWYAVPQRPPHH